MYLKQGHRLHNDKYQLLHVLGEGGFSLTYRGIWKAEVQGNLGKLPTFVPVCIKEYFFKDYCLRNPHTHFVETNSETGKEIFNKNKEKIIREARILSEIQHPNVVNVLEVFKQNNTVYIVMEFIAGHSLKQEVEQNGVLTEKKLKKIIFRIGQALAYIHEKNILHLDIKPSNILMDKNNNPKLIDFGISKKYDLSYDQETSTALLAASKGYASIEQYDSEGMPFFSPRPDIYSLGATMYYLVTGQVPTESILRSTKGLQNPCEINTELSENTEKVILKAMALNASDRYESIMDMLSDLGFDSETDKIDLAAANDSEYAQLTKKINEQPYDVDNDDETIIRSGSTKTNRRKKRNRLIYVASALVITTGLSGFFIYGNLPRKLQVESYVENTAPIQPGSNLSDQPAPPDTVPEKRNDNSQSPAISNVNTAQTIEPADTKSENYQKTFNEALIAYQQQNFDRALVLFKQAASSMETADTKNYIALSERELEKIEIQKRKNLYEELMYFGTFVVVMKKSDYRYGAIDDKGNEVIPCKYANTDPSGDNRLFQRDDNWYDLYAPSGVLLKEKTNGFE